MQSPAFPLGYPAAGGNQGLPVNVDGRGDNRNLSGADSCSLGLVEAFDQAVLEGDGQFTHGDLHVDGVGVEAALVLDDDAAGLVGSAGDLDDALAGPGGVGGLGHEVVFDEFPHLLRAVLVGALGFFLGFAEAAADLGFGHANGDLVFGNEGVNHLAALLAFLEAGEEALGEGFELGEGQPGDHATLLGVAADAGGVFGEGLDLHGLRVAQGADVAGHGEIEVGGGVGAGDFQFERFEVKIGLERGKESSAGYSV